MSSFMLIRRRLARRGLAALFLLGSAAGSTTRSAAQAPKVFFACYVPTSGSVYRIKEPNTPPACGTSNKKGQTVQHVEFSWTDGAGGDHGALTGLGDDDHPQYVLAEGVRTSNAGFALVQGAGGGGIPVSGPGNRLMWYPGKGAFRAGGVLSGQWDDALIGNSSAALGWNTIASGTFSFAAGVAAIASGDRSVALGSSARATGYGAFAAGEGVHASGAYSVALGSTGSTNDKSGAFVFADASNNSSYVNAQADNQFVVRAQQFWLGTNNNVTATPLRFIETSTGAFLSTGGTWTNSSDSARKTGFMAVDGEDLLARLAAMPITSWNYRSEDSSVRHIGPTAQAFRAAFSFGDSDKAIATIDADGVSLATIQALVKRTNVLAGENAALRLRLDELEQRLAQLLARPGVSGGR